MIMKCWHLLAPLLVTTIFAKAPVGNTVMGVDLGGAMMKVAYVAPGEEEPFPILSDDLSKRKWPHAVAHRRGKWLFGAHAVKAASMVPESSFVYYLPFLLGQLNDSEQVEKYRSLFTPSISKDEARGTCQVMGIDQKAVPIEYIAALYLENLIERCQTVSGRYAAGAVITVPAYFTQMQRQALLDAAGIAGLKVLALVNPASAAAVLYGTQIYRGDSVRNVLLVDFGASATTAVVARIDPSFKQSGIKMPSIEIKSIAYDTQLSGMNISLRVANLLAEKFEKKHDGIKIASGKAFNRLFFESNRVKEILSANTEIVASIDELVGDFSLNEEITRSELERNCEDMSPIISKVINEALGNVKLTMEDISVVIPLGGNTRVPFIADTIQKIAGSKVGSGMIAEEAAASGASILAASYYNFKLKPFKFKDVLTTGLVMNYKAIGNENSVTLYPPNISHSESRQGSSIRNIDQAEFLFSELPSNRLLYKMKVDGFNEAVSKVGHKVLDSKMKIWADINRNGLFTIEPPAALIEVEKMVTSTIKATQSTETGASTGTATSTTDPTTSSVPDEVKVVPVKAVEKVLLNHQIENILVPFDKKLSDDLQGEIKKIRDEINAGIRRAAARNQLESACDHLVENIQTDEFIRWYKSNEITLLNSAIGSANKLLEENKPEYSAENFKKEFDNIKEIQKSPNHRKDESFKRTEVVPSVLKIAEEVASYANNTLTVFEPENRAQSNEELEALFNDANTFLKELSEKTDSQAKLADNEDPVFNCSELSIQADLLRLRMDMLKKKVLPPKTPTTEIPPTSAEPDKSSNASATDSPAPDAAAKEHSEL